MIDLGFFTLQVSEVSRLFFFIWLSGYIVRNDFNKDYRFSKYGLQSDRIFINSSNYEFDIKIIVDDPISKNQIIAADMINSNYSILTLSDGSEKPIYLESDRTSGQYLDGDSISVSLYNENRFGEYFPECQLATDGTCC